ncbi:alcohol dehydrogenase catalytic domain-containing protein [Antribacter sp. KLBMP9083]|uniref:Alcohol dehydrogenase catalytic domain-containing protein n=1 Tax=Antribacter soli TaxID=2910976 RepID=A0AA41QH52_9MICO|nr:alcohol dehydrogenase catalytic domain-containing protein [Antribacter soli]MCF4123364.1 alcohol dehydrogenase catalytic domain-containing protein [Antribacter soli]
MSDRTQGTWPTGTMTAARITSVGTVEACTVPVPDPQPGYVLVRVELVGLCGTDLELLHGEATYITDGRIALPWTFGHEWTGTVLATSGETQDIRPGLRVVGQTMVPCLTCASCRSGQRSLCLRMREIGLYGLDGAAAEYVSVPCHALVPVPDSVGDNAAVLVEPAVTVARALADTHCSLADSVAVVGTGTIGLLAVMLARAMASEVVAVGVDPAGLDLALELGADRALLNGEAPSAEFSLVVEASGSPSGFLEAVRLARTGGRIAAVGVVSGGLSAFPAGEITLRGLTLHGIRHGLDHYDQTLKMFADGLLRADPLIHSTHPLSRPGEAFDALTHRQSGRPKVLLSARA